MNLIIHSASLKHVFVCSEKNYSTIFDIQEALWIHYGTVS